MAGFAENMMTLFGFDPTKGQTLSGPAPLGARAPQTQAGADQTQAMSDVAGRPYSPEAADWSTPSPTGRVLARLRVPGQQQTRARGAAPAAGDGEIGSGFGSDLAAGLGAVKVGEDKGSAFLHGFAGAAKNIEDRRAAAQKAATESQKANLELLKSMFDMKGKMEDRAQKAAETATSNARNDRTDAETKRWHDIMAPSYSKDASGKGDKELGPKDAILAEQRLQEMSGYKPGDDNFQFLPDAEKARRRTVFQRLYQNQFGRPYEFDADGMPVVRQKAPKDSAADGGKNAAKTGAKSTADDDEEDDAPAAAAETPTPPARPQGLTPAAPATPDPTLTPQGGGAPAAAAPPPQQPAPAAPQVWRKYRSTDGAVKLYNPATGESKPIDAGPAAPSPLEEQMMQGGN